MPSNDMELGRSKEIDQYPQQVNELEPDKEPLREEDKSPHWLKRYRVRLLQSPMRARDVKTIHRIHPNIRKLNEDAYAPSVVSIGPYHHGNQQLQAMEDIKAQRLITQNSNLGIFERLDSIEAAARSCYSESINLATTDFVGMMMMDGFFIVDLLLEASSPSMGHEIVNGPPWMLNYIAHDMLLLENQLPFFVLLHIFEILMSERTTKLSLSELAISFFHRFLIPTEREIFPKESKPTHHLLDLIHSYLSPTHTWLEQSQMLTRPNRKSKPKYQSKRLDEGFLLPKFSSCCPLSSSDSNKVPPPRQQPVLIPSATKLKEAGVKFKKNGGAESMLEIRFYQGVMEIPPFYFNTHSEFLYRNLIAFEQHCVDPKSYCLTTYAVFMEHIIKTANDVEILQQNEILQHGWGSDKDVAHMFNNLCKGATFFHPNYLSDTTEDILAHCNLKRNQWRASLVHDYFYNPWAIISVIAAFVVLALTFIQTYFSVISFASPH